MVHAALEALIARQASKRLAALGGTEKRLEEIPRRRAALLRKIAAMRILADTSIWINHPAERLDTVFQGFLEEGIVLMHPCVRCELALGNLKYRSAILALIARLPQSEVATNDEVLHIIEAKNLWGLGIGWVDAQLIAATRLTEACILWTLDTRLRKTCEKAGAKLFHREP